MDFYGNAQVKSPFSQMIHHENCGPMSNSQKILKVFFWVQTLVSSVNVANKKTSLGTAINMFIISSGSLFILVVLICGILGSPILGRNHLVLLIISYDLSHDMYTLLYILPLITSHLELFENKFFFF